MFGTVRLARRRKAGANEGQLLALKIVRKAAVIKWKQTAAVMEEKKMLLLAGEHPFVLQLRATFQDSAHLYFLTELIQGGELFLHQSQQEGQVFSESDALFYAACVESVLEFLHAKQIVYRDIKPENMMLHKSGYLTVVDFGFARSFADSGKCFTLCGTPEYLAPEVILATGYTTSADIWAAGVLLFEMMVGYSPFAPDNPSQVKLCKRIVGTPVVRPNDAGLSDAAWNLIRGMLEREVSERLGCLAGGHSDIKAHRWWSSSAAGGAGSGSDEWWTALERREHRAPWIPEIDGGKETFLQYFDAVEEEEKEVDEAEEASAADADHSWSAGF